jgi:hypothetical protein
MEELGHGGSIRRPWRLGNEGIESGIGGQGRYEKEAKKVGKGDHRGTVEKGVVQVEHRKHEGMQLRAWS